jgi:hypothetical protein
MKIYQNEITDGIAEVVRTDTSVAYCVPATISTVPHSSCSREFLDKIKASSANPKQVDLYYLKSVLVSTGWNKNDDVFSPEATWAARSTPEDKQFNFMHNENDIIGHITGSYVVDRDGNAIAENTEDTPKEFDIITEAVLYNSWTNTENRARMQQIIAEIEEGKWFVSMECLFAGFDYSILGEDGQAKVVARDEKSSFLTKHLRAYGGTGEYEGYKIGRSLRDISFSGKGLVSKPANPRSVILDASKAFSTNDSNFTQVSQGEVNMADTNVLERQLAEVQTELASAKEENKAIRAQIEAAKDKEYADTIASLEGDLTAKADEISALQEKLAATEEAVKSLEDSIADMHGKMEKKEEEMKKMKKMQRDEKRKASLVEAGFDADEAEESVALYDVLEDEAFNTIVAMYNKKMKAKKDMKKEEEVKAEVDASDAVEDSKAEEEVSEELFDGVKSTEATLVDASDDTDELEATRASVAEWLENNVLHK